MADGLRRRVPSWLRWLLAVGVSALSLYLALRGVIWAEVRGAFLAAEWRWFAPLLASVACSVALKAGRWRRMYAAGAALVGLGTFARIVLAGQAVNALYPARLGDVLRVDAIGRRTPAGGRAFALGTLATEKTLDTLAYALLLMGLLLSVSLPDWLRSSAWGGIGLASVLVVGMFLLVLGGRHVLGILHAPWIPMPARPRQWLIERGENFLASLDIFRDAASLSALSLFTILIWLMAILNNWLAFQAFHLDLPFRAAALLLAALQAGISLPTVPGALGVFQYICVLVLALYGVSDALAFSYGVFLHGMVMLPTTMAGLLCLWRLGWGSYGR